MRFFTGLDEVSHAKHFDAAFISVNRLRRRKGPFAASDWIMDSGAFSTILKHGGYPHPVSEYAEQIRRFAGCGNLLAAVAQDYMCEEHMLAITGLTVLEHQRLTISRYLDLLAEDVGGVYIMPVLQGYEPAEYVDHLTQYGDLIAPGAWVGVGSVCKRNGNPRAVAAVLHAIKEARPDLRLHGFGLKKTALADSFIVSMLHSADSMAWSYAARREGRDHHDWAEAAKYAAEIASIPVQGLLAWFAWELLA